MLHFVSNDATLSRNQFCVWWCSLASQLYLFLMV